MSDTMCGCGVEKMLQESAEDAWKDTAAAEQRAERAEAEHRMCSVTEAKLLARIKRAEAAIQRVRELHVPRPCEAVNGRQVCAVCAAHTKWPCPTIAALDSTDAARRGAEGAPITEEERA